MVLPRKSCFIRCNWSKYSGGYPSEQKMDPFRRGTCENKILFMKDFDFDVLGAFQRSKCLGTLNSGESMTPDNGGRQIPAGTTVYGGRRELFKQ